MRNEHLRLLLDNEADSNRFFEVSQAFAQAKIPDEIVSALRVGQLTALEKPNGGVRGIVVGDVIGLLVAKNNVSAIHREVRECHKTVSICFVHESWVRKYCTRGAGFDRQRRFDDRVVHRRCGSFRIDLT